MSGINGNRIRVYILTKRGLKIDSGWHRPSKSVKWFLDLAIKLNWLRIIEGLSYFANKDITWKEIENMLKAKKTGGKLL